MAYLALAEEALSCDPSMTGETSRFMLTEREWNLLFQLGYLGYNVFDRD